DHRDPAALHGFLHDLHRGRGADRRRARQLDHLPLDRPGEDRARPVRPRPGGGDVDHLLPDHPLHQLAVLYPGDAERDQVMRKRALIPAIYILFLLLPIYWLVTMSFKTTNEILGGFTLWPR